MNEKKTSSKKPVIILAVVIVLVAAVLVGIYFATRPDTQEGVKNITIVYTAHDETYPIELQTDAEFLGKALTDNALVAGDQGEFGLYIVTFNGVTADEANQEWWSITKGGEMVETGADTTPIQDGDTFEITLMTGWDSF